MFFLVQMQICQCVFKCVHSVMCMYVCFTFYICKYKNISYCSLYFSLYIQQIQTDTCASHCSRGYISYLTKDKEGHVP